MSTPKCLEGLPLIALGAEGPMLYTIVEVNAAVLPLEAEITTLRAEVARLSTWVEAVAESTELLRGTARDALKWTPPCDCLIYNEYAPFFVRGGKAVLLDAHNPIRYLPITLPRGTK